MRMAGHIAVLPKSDFVEAVEKAFEVLNESQSIIRRYVTFEEGISNPEGYDILGGFAIFMRSKALDILWSILDKDCRKILLESLLQKELTKEIDYNDKSQFESWLLIGSTGKIITLQSCNFSRKEFAVRVYQDL